MHSAIGSMAQVDDNLPIRLEHFTLPAGMVKLAESSSNVALQIAPKHAGKPDLLHNICATGNMCYWQHFMPRNFTWLGCNRACDCHNPGHK
jgi:hypothetical protein